MPIVAQHILAAGNPLSVLEPTVGNGSLITTLPESASITGIEVDGVRLNNAKSLMEKGGKKYVGIEGDYLNYVGDSKFDAVISNPPFGALDKPITMSGLGVMRLDHQILMKALATLP